MTEDDTEEEMQDSTDEERRISIEYTPAEIIALLQLLDYLDVYMLKEGLPLGAIGMTRRKILDEIMKEGVSEDLRDEQEDKFEMFKEMMGHREAEELKDEMERSGFQ